MDYVVSSRIQSIVFLLRVNGENVCNWIRHTFSLTKRKSWETTHSGSASSSMKTDSA